MKSIVVLCVIIALCDSCVVARDKENILVISHEAASFTNMDIEMEIDPSPAPSLTNRKKTRRGRIALFWVTAGVVIVLIFSCP